MGVGVSQTACINAGGNYVAFSDDSEMAMSGICACPKGQYLNRKAKMCLNYDDAADPFLNENYEYATGTACLESGHKLNTDETKIMKGVNGLCIMDSCRTGYNFSNGTCTKEITKEDANGKSTMTYSYKPGYLLMDKKQKMEDIFQCPTTSAVAPPAPTAPPKESKEYIIWVLIAILIFFVLLLVFAAAMRSD